MTIDDAITLLAGWLGVVHVESAEMRIAEARANYRAEAAASVGVTPGAVARAAWHEASHAVIGHVLGLRVAEAVVRSDAAGHVEYEPIDDAASGALATVVTDLAGAAAELLADVDFGRQHQLAHSHDILKARLGADRVRELTPGWGVTNESVARFCVCIVATRWGAIERVAASLRATGRLDGPSVAALCGAPN